MKSTVKILALLLSLLMLVATFAACTFKKPDESNNNNQSSDVVDSDEPTATETETTDFGDIKLGWGVPEDYDAGGATVNILIRSAEQYRREWYNEGELDALQNEIHYRNLDVEEYLGVKLNYILNTKADEKMNELIEQAGKGGTGAYDIVSNYSAYASSTNVLQYYLNFNNGQLKYVDTTKAYWNQNYIKAAQSFDRLFLCVGDANLSVYDRAIVTFYNKAKAEVYLSDVDLYQMVLDKQWTYDVFYDLVANVHEDNGTTDTADDFYGLASIKGSEAFDGFFGSWKLNVTQADDEGKHTLVTDTAYTRLSNAFVKAAEIWASDGAIMISGSGANYEFFTQGHALFDIDVMYHYESGNKMLREMEDGFGVLPVPMLDDDQDTYYCGMQDAHNAMSVMCHFKQDYERTGAVLNCIQAISYEKVRPYYIEKIVKGQFLDQKSNSVFGYILDGTRWDYADVYHTALGGIRHKIWRGPLIAGAQSVDTAFTGNLEAFNESLTTIDEWFQTHY